MGIEKKWSVDDIKNSSLLAINYAYQNAIPITWNCGIFKLKENDLLEIRELINPDNNIETGSKLVKWFDEKWDSKFYMGDFEYIGKCFMLNFDRFHK